MYNLSIKQFHHYGWLLLGVAILSFGLFNIHTQSQVTEGGILGLTLLLQHWFGISPGISNFFLNLFCFAAGFHVLGKTFLKNAIFSSVTFSICYYLSEQFGPILPELHSMPLLAAVLGGLFVGIGVGIVVRAGGASGGDDALAIIIAKCTNKSISQAYLATDVIVLLLSLSYIPAAKILFSMITVMISSALIGVISNC